MPEPICDMRVMVHAAEDRDVIVELRGMRTGRTLFARCLRNFAVVLFTVARPWIQGARELSDPLRLSGAAPTTTTEKP